MQNSAQRRRDLPLREDPGGHLVEQRLEEVVVVPIDEGDPDRSTAQDLGREQAAEASADDQHSMGTRGHGLPVEERGP